MLLTAVGPGVRVTGQTTSSGWCPGQSDMLGARAAHAVILRIIGAFAGEAGLHASAATTR